MTRTCHFRREMKDFFYRQYSHDEGIRLHLNQQPDACLARIDISMVANALRMEEQAMLSWLSSDEQDYMKRFRFPKRRHEWLSGRIAAKHCLLQIKEGQNPSLRAKTFSILPDEHGQPIVSSAPTSYLRKISISHSHQYAVAIAADRSCGIDIQKIGSQILTVQDRIATTAEISLVQKLLSGDMQTSLTLIWTIKEALKKHKLPDQPGIFEAIVIEQIYPDDRQDSWRAECRLTATNRYQTVKAVLIDQYMLAWCRG